MKHLFKCSHNSTFFPWSWTCLTEKRGVKQFQTPLNKESRRQFWWCDTIFKKSDEISFMGMNLSWHSYQLTMSQGIKCLWNYRMKLCIESDCFIQVSLHFIWYDIFGNNTIKFSTEIGLITLGNVAYLTSGRTDACFVQLWTTHNAAYLTSVDGRFVQLWTAQNIWAYPRNNTADWWAFPSAPEYSRRNLGPVAPHAPFWKVLVWFW
jgi:hypothetical protein